MKTANVILVALIFLLSACRLGSEHGYKVGEIKCFEDDPFETRCFTLLETRETESGWPTYVYDKVLYNQTGNVKVLRRENSPFNWGR